VRLQGASEDFCKKSEKAPKSECITMIKNSIL